MINIYRRNFGRKIRHLRRDVFGYSIAHFAHLVDCDKDTIYEIEIGAIKCPEPQLILRIADVLDSFYMQFVRPKYEKIFLYNLNWGTSNPYEILSMMQFTQVLGDAIIQVKNHKMEEDNEK